MYSNNLEKLYYELLLIVWWPEEEAKWRKSCLEGAYPNVLALLDDVERSTTRLRDECMHPDYRKMEEDRVELLKQHFQLARDNIEYLMRFAGGSTNLDKRGARSTQTKSKVQDLSYSRFKKWVDLIGCELAHPLPECVARRFSSITLGKPRCEKCKHCKVCGVDASGTHSQLKI